MPFDNLGDDMGFSDSMDSGGEEFQVVNHRKRKERSKSLSTGSEGESRRLKERRVGEFNVIVKLSGNGGRGINPIKLAELLGEEIGSFQHAISLTNGRILVECNSKCQQEKALALKSLKKFDVEVYVPGTRTKAKGVIYGVPLGISNNEIMQEINSEVVVEAKRIQVTRNSVKVDSQTVVLTFKSQTIPRRVQLGYLSFQVKPYIRPPLRCFNCQRYGHVAAVCRGRRKCGRCGADHSYGECEPQASLCCPNCGEEHSAAYKGCRQYVKAVEVQRVRTNQRVSYAEALRRVNIQQNDKQYPQKPPQPPRVQIVHTPPDDSIMVKKIDFLAFIADVVSGSKFLGPKNRSDVIKLVSIAAGRYLKMSVTPESLFQFLKSGENRTMSQSSEVAAAGEG